MAEGSVYKRCGCRSSDGKRLEAACPKLRRKSGSWSRDHGVWYYQIELPPTVSGTRRKPLRRGGFASHGDADNELKHVRELLALADAADTVLRSSIAELIVATVRETRALPKVEVVRRKVRTGQDLGGSITVGEWLADFLVRKRKIEESTRRAYASHIRLYLQPYLGHIRLDRLRVADIAGMYEAIEEVNDTIHQARASGDPDERAAVRGRRPVSPATMHRIRATLRHALNLAIKQERLIDFNPAAVIELPDAVRPKALVWTAERVRHWHSEHARHLATARERAAGKRVNVVDVWVGTPRPSPVMVWTPQQTSRFLDGAAQHRLFALYRLVALRGLRRGEACGLRWKDVDLNSGVVAICWQIIQLGWDTIEGKPKTDASERIIALDAQTITILQAHRKRQARELLAAGPARVDSGFVFTNPNGSRLHPQHLTDQFCWLAYTAGLPPIRLHDLRHGAASMMLAAGVDVKVVQETLGHTSSSFTRDTYTSVYPEVAKAAAEKTAALLTPAPNVGS